MGISEAISASIKESRELEQAGSIGEAYHKAQEALINARASQQNEAIAAAALSLASVYFRMGHDQEALELANEALARAEPDNPVRVDALLMIGMCGDCEDYISVRERHYHEAIDVSRRLGYRRGLLRGLHNLSSGVYLPRGQFDLALAADNEALRLAGDPDLANFAWWPLTTLSWIYWLTGQSVKAKAALAELNRISQPGSLSKGYYFCTAANLAIDEGLIDQAPPLYAKARSIAETIGSPDLEVYVRLGMCRYHRSVGDFSAACDWAKDALDIARRVNYPFLQAQALIEQGRAALSAEASFSVIQGNFLAAIEILAPLKANFELARARLLLACLFYEHKRSDAEKVWLEAATQIIAGGFDFLVSQERTLIYSLLGVTLNSRNPALARTSSELLQSLMRAPVEPLRIVTLGGLQVWRGAQYIDQSALRQRRAGELLALLLVSPRHSLLIDQVTEALCPDEEPATAQSILHHATSCLRKALEPELPPKLPSRYLQVEKGQVYLNLPEGSRSDLDEFERACQKGEWEVALALYEGELLPEFLYSDWSTIVRQRADYRMQQALLILAEKRFQDLRFSDALEFCRRLLEIDPWQEKAVLLAMRTCQAMGDIAGALHLYQSLQRTLSEELGTFPAPEIQTLAQEISQNRKRGG